MHLVLEPLAPVQGMTDADMCLQGMSRRGWKSPRLARPSTLVSIRVVDLMY
jgi:hypothetical protein